jgi:hypothetical protein
MFESLNLDPKEDLSQNLPTIIAEVVASEYLCWSESMLGVATAVEEERQTGRGIADDSKS